MVGRSRQQHTYLSGKVSKVWWQQESLTGVLCAGRHFADPDAAAVHAAPCTVCTAPHMQQLKHTCVCHVVAMLQVSVLAEGSSLPLTELSELISRTLSSSSSSPPCKQAAVEAPAEPPGTQDAAAAAAAGSTQEAAAAAAGSTAEAGGPGGGPSALVVRNLIQEAASRKSYGLQDGEFD